MMIEWIETGSRWIDPCFCYPTNFTPLNLPVKKLIVLNNRIYPSNPMIPWRPKILEIPVHFCVPFSILCDTCQSDLEKYYYTVIL